MEVLELLIPCILHLENRIGEKIITILLRMGLNLHQGPKLGYIEKIQDVFRTKVLGTEESPSHWHLPHDKDNDGNVVVEPVQVKNNVCRSIMKDVNAMIDAALPLGRTDGE